MNVVSRGIRNALRTPLRSSAIIIMLAISIALSVAMLVAKSSVDMKIADVKANAANKITITPAGVRGGFGGGDPLTSDQVTKIVSTAHVSSTTDTLTDQAGSDDTNLQPAFELGGIGRRLQRFEGATESSADTSATQDQTRIRAPQARTVITGTNDLNSITTDGSALSLKSGALIDASSETNVALLGTTLADKNSLKVGSTFTLYGKTFTVAGIYETKNRFQDTGMVIPLKTLQTLTSQVGAVTNIIATIDSSDNVTSTVSALKTSLGDSADIVSDAERAASSTESLASISDLALTGVIGATVAGAAIVLLTMTMIVRERRREIGVIKAIGGTDLKVITQFISEALTLTLIGGVVGIGLGVVVSGNITQSLVANESSSNQRGEGGPIARGGGGPGEFGRAFNRGVNDVTSTITPQTFIIASSITLLIAVIGSAVPAWLIARVRPTEVLRTE